MFRRLIYNNLKLNQHSQLGHPFNGSNHPGFNPHAGPSIGSQLSQTPNFDPRLIGLSEYDAYKNKDLIALKNSLSNKYCFNNKNNISDEEENDDEDENIDDEEDSLITKSIDNHRNSRSRSRSKSRSRSNSFSPNSRNINISESSNFKQMNQSQNKRQKLEFPVQPNITPSSSLLSMAAHSTPFMPAHTSLLNSMIPSGGLPAANLQQQQLFNAYISALSGGNPSPLLASQILAQQSPQLMNKTNSNKPSTKKCDISNIESLIESNDNSKKNNNLLRSDCSLTSTSSPISSNSSSCNNSPLKPTNQNNISIPDLNLTTAAAFNSMNPQLLWYLYASNAHNNLTNNNIGCPITDLERLTVPTSQQKLSPTVSPKSISDVNKQMNKLNNRIKPYNIPNKKVMNDSISSDANEDNVNDLNTDDCNSKDLDDLNEQIRENENVKFEKEYIDNDKSINNEEIKNEMDSFNETEEREQEDETGEREKDISYHEQINEEDDELNESNISKRSEVNPNTTDDMSSNDISDLNTKCTQSSRKKLKTEDNS
jgi:hypothetical protein